MLNGDLDHSVRSSARGTAGMARNFKWAAGSGAHAGTTYYGPRSGRWGSRVGPEGRWKKLTGDIPDYLSKVGFLEKKKGILPEPRGTYERV